MKTKLFYLVILSALFCYRCKKDNAVSPNIDTPVEFDVSKGTYVDRIKVSWDIPPKAMSFEVYRADSTISDYSLIGKTSFSYYYDSANHIANKKYYYKVRVYNSEKDFSNFTNYDYGFVSKFNSPVLTASHGTSNHYIVLVWSAVTGNNRYFIYRSSNNKDFDILDSTLNNSWNDNKDLSIGPTYYYKIRAFNRLIGFSDFSNTDSGYIFQSYSFIKTFGSFTLASYIDFDSKGNVYISDATVGKVREFDIDYNYIKDFISIQGTIIRGIKIIHNDTMIIAESDKGKVGFYDSNGTFIKEKTVASTTILRQLTTDDQGNIYVTDVANGYVVQLNSNGDFIKQWKPYCSGEDVTYEQPYGILYYNNSLLVVYANASPIGIFSPDGNYIRKWNIASIGSSCIAMDSNLNFYFANYGQVIKTDKAGKILSMIGTGNLGRALTLNVASNGDVLVTDEDKPTEVAIYRLSDNK